MKTGARSIKNVVLLMLAALIWGIAFVAQSVAMDHVGAFTFNGLRSVLGGIVLLPVIAVSGAVKKKSGTYQPMDKAGRKTLIIGGIICGICLCVATNLQQFALKDAEAGKAGFITALYIVIVPVLGIFFKKKVRPIIWACVAIAVAGMYLLCVSGSMSLATSDILLMLCALVFSFHILAIDHFSPKVDGVKLSCIQFFVCGGISCIMMFIFEKPDWASICAAYIPLLYAGIFSCGVAYTFQILGQKDFNPTVASLILSLESVFSVLAGWIILGQTLSLVEMGGCVMIFIAIILAQFPARKKPKSKPIKC